MSGICSLRIKFKFHQQNFTTVRQHIQPNV